MTAPVVLRETRAFATWLARLSDRVGRAKILARLDRLRLGNAGDVSPIGKGVSELRVDYGPGYRIYFVRQGVAVILLLCGGDKSSQRRDIQLAHKLAGELKDERS